jgi:hypothetical protein
MALHMLEYCSQALSCMVRMRHNRPHWLLHEAHSTMSSGSNADARACTPAASRARSMVRASVRARLIRNEKAGAARLLCAQSSTAPRWPNRVSQRATSHRGWLVASAIALTCWRRTLRGSGGVQIRGVATGGPRTRAGQHHADPSHAVLVARALRRGRAVVCEDEGCAEMCTAETLCSIVRSGSALGRHVCAPLHLWRDLWQHLCQRAFAPHVEKRSEDGVHKPAGSAVSTSATELDMRVRSMGCHAAMDNLECSHSKDLRSTTPVVFRCSHSGCLIRWEPVK